jgi:Na+-transporting methylmalonyl-CoA/oxaloacetate decarboxylase gamma subunit
LLTLAAALGQVPLPAVKLLALVLALLTLLAALIGSTAVARHVGLGLADPQRDTCAWRLTLRGGTVLGLTFVLPLLGWFLILPLVLFAGLGAFVRVAWSARRAARETSAVTAT